jgi:hypothetical protein
MELAQACKLLRVRHSGYVAHMIYKPAQLASRIWALAEKRVDQAKTAADTGSRQRFEQVARNYHSLAALIARQEDLRALPGLLPRASSRIRIDLQVEEGAVPRTTEHSGEF